MADSHDVSKHIKLYVGVFLALLVGTVITVGMYYVHFNSLAMTVGVALLIASIKSFLVAGYFMHLTAEKKTIYVILGITVVFFIGMMGLCIWSLLDTPTPKGV